jgi:hypothetical protein
LSGQKLSDANANMNDRKGGGTYGGLMVTQQLKGHWHLELGINFAQEQFSFEPLSGDFRGNVYFKQDQLHIPLRIQYREDIFGDHVDLFSSIGTSFVINSRQDPVPYGIFSDEISASSSNPGFSTLLDFRAGFDVFLGKRKNFFLTSSYHYSAGFTTTTQINVESANGEYDYRLNYKGSRHTIQFGIGYRISRIWNKVKQEENAEE